VSRHTAMSSRRVLRGGSYRNTWWCLWVTARYWVPPEDWYKNRGFRLVRGRKP